MTMLELAEFTDCSKFELIVLDSKKYDDEPEEEQNILFAVPIPPPFGIGLQWSKDPDGGIKINNYDINDFMAWTDVYDFMAWTDAWAAYIDYLTAPKQNRTRKQAEAGGAIVNLPDRLALPTYKKFQDAITTVRTKITHLQPVKEEKVDIQFKDGTTYLSGIDTSCTDKEKIEQLEEFMQKNCDYSPQTISKLDLPTLRALYSIILRDVDMETMRNPEELEKLVDDPQHLTRNTKIYLPDFLRMIGHKPNSSNEAVGYAIKKIMSYGKILGIIEDYKGGRLYKSYYPVMLFLGYEAKDNTIMFSSPYLNKLVIRVMQASIKTDKKGQAKLKSNGEPFTNAVNSYLIKSSIVKEKNKRAVEIVCIVVTLIEQAGNNKNKPPHILARTIVDRCPDLKNALDAAKTSKDKSIILKRAFSKAWELLRTQTYLSDTYKNIILPTTVPTAGTLDSMVFEFPHEGKTKNEKPKIESPNS